MSTLCWDQLEIAAFQGLGTGPWPYLNSGAVDLLFSFHGRIHVYIEDLLEDEQLISLMQDLLLLSDRAKLADLPALAASG